MIRPRTKAAVTGKPRVPLEAAVQRQIISGLQLMRVLAIHVPNAGKRSVVAGRRLKGEGMRAGTPDLICVGFGRTAWLEVKRPGYTASAVQESQYEMHALLRERGADVAIVASVDDAVTALRGFGWPL